jgi:hypothetical protein
MKYIDEYHEELELMIPIPELVFDGGETIEDFLVQERAAISNAIADAVELMVKFGVETMPCFAVKDTGLIFNLNRDDAGYSVDQCIAYFTEVEDYEKCILLTNIKTKL